MNIDLRKKPEGATHYAPGDGNTLGFVWINYDIGTFGAVWYCDKWSPMDRKIPRDDIVAIEWNVEGLPPVGTVCEFAGGTHCPEDPFDKDLKEGMKVTIIAHFKCGDFTLAAFTFDPENPDRGMVQVEQANFGCFRPIRTPEQIAAEERERGIVELHKWFSEFGEKQPDIRTYWSALYDAGFRVPEVKP